MANIMTVIISGEAPEIIAMMPCVLWYGRKAIRPMPLSDIRKAYGNTLIHTRDASAVMNKLESLGFTDIYWQDLDGYGPCQVFKRT